MVRGRRYQVRLLRIKGNQEPSPKASNTKTEEETSMKLLKTMGAVALAATVAFISLVTTETHEVTRIDGDYVDATNTTQDADRRADKPGLYVTKDRVLNGADVHPGDTVRAFYLRMKGEDKYLNAIVKEAGGASK